MLKLMEDSEHERHEGALEQALQVLNDALKSSKAKLSWSSGKVSLKTDSKTDELASPLQAALMQELTKLISHKKSATIEVGRDYKSMHIGQATIEDGKNRYRIDMGDVERFRKGILPGSAVSVLVHELVEMSWMQFDDLKQDEAHVLACQAECDITGGAKRDPKAKSGMPVVYKRHKSITKLSWTTTDLVHETRPEKIDKVKYEESRG